MTSPSPENPSPDPEVLVRVEGVSKKLCRSLKKSLWYGLCDMSAELWPFGRNGGGGGQGKGADPVTLRDGEFWAVDNVSFELRRGESLGLIGHNGAGKTTLLKMLNGLIKPDTGRITVRGRVGALIALGAGFNPILTGRENIYINGSILGLTRREIDARIEEIIDFSEIGEFIDTPVQNYSSGMQVRLGFAVATALEPDVLILDEVLAVGDVSFRAKCYARIGQLQKKAAVIFVSHAMDQVARLCGLGLYLSHGRSEGMTSVEQAADAYEKGMFGTSSTGEASFERLAHPVVSVETKPFHHLNLGDDLVLEFQVRSVEPVRDSYFRLVFFSPDGAHAGELNSRFGQLDWHLHPGLNRCRLTLPNLSLRPGLYKLGLMFFQTGNIEPLIWLYKKIQVEVSGPRLGLAPYAISRATFTHMA
jgi:lipopolysaccharide transport system ATP-binding protein